MGNHVNKALNSTEKTESVDTCDSPPLPSPPRRSKSDERADLILGKLLRMKGIITNAQLNKALDFQKRTGADRGHPVYLGVAVVEMGFATEEEIIDAINEHYRLEVKSLSDNIEELIRNRRRLFGDVISGPRIPIWLQLTVATTFIVVLTIVSLSYVLLGQLKEQLYRQTVNVGRVSLNYFVNNSRIPLLEENILPLNVLINEAAEVEGLLYAMVVDQQNIVRAHTNPEQIGDRFDGIDESTRIFREGNVRFSEFVTDNNRRVLNLSRIVRFQQKVLGEVHVGISIDFVRRMIRERTTIIVIVTSLILFFGIIIAVMLGFRFSRPIWKLVEATQAIGSGNYQYKVDMVRNDELGSLAAAFNRMSRDLWKKSLMQESFGKYIGSEVLEMIMANPTSAWLKGHKSNATILFTDIRGFTGFSENQDPETVVEALNNYFEITTNIILQNGGYVDKFIGDALMAVFGVPVPYPNHTERAVRAAVEVQRGIEEALAKGKKLPGAVGVSINTGLVVSGNIGSQVKMEYTIIGDSVNVASRLNGLAGPGEIIVSEAVRNQMGNRMTVEAMPPRKLKGRIEPVNVYKLLELKDINDGSTAIPLRRGA
jgi:adenylate cyclase